MTSCGAGHRCHSFDQGAQLAAPAALPALLCADCLRLAERDIASMPSDYADLEQLLPGGTAGLSTKVSGRAAPGVPIDLGVDALQRELVWALTSWEAPVREAAGLSVEVSEGVRPGWAVSTAARVIAPRVDLVSQLAPVEGYWRGIEAASSAMSGLEGIAALRRIHGRCRGLLGITRLVYQLPGECSGCGMQALRRQDERETVYCANCARLWTLADYRRYVGLLLERA